ncbi:MAG: hypothetical protein J6D28_01335 [Bacilli bacterium]|nr:hypothetical protein [Bacilli bacterium]
MPKNKQEAVKLIQKKLNNQSFLSYIEIAEITGYHEKYILKLKKDILNNKISFEHGNKNKKPINAISEEEKKQIIELYKRSKVSIRKFCMFYGTRSYSCIYNIIKEYKDSFK